MPVGVGRWRPFFNPAPPPGLAPTREWRPLAAVLAGILAFFAINPFLAIGSADGHVATLVLPLTVGLPLALGAWTALKHRTYQVRDLAIALPGGVLALAAGPWAALSVVLCVLASIWMLRARNLDLFPWWGWLNPKPWASGVVQGVVTGLIVGVLLVVIGSTELVRPSIGLGHVLAGTANAVAAEAGIRLFLLTWSFFVLGGIPQSKAQSRLCTLMMVLPVVGLMTARHIANANWLGVLMEGTIVGLLYALPFARLLKRYGVASALIAHALAEIIHLAALSS